MSWHTPRWVSLQSVRFCDLGTISARLRMAVAAKVTESDAVGDHEDHIWSRHRMGSTRRRRARRVTDLDAASVGDLSARPVAATGAWRYQTYRYR